MIEVTAHMSNGWIRNVNYPLAEAVEVNIYDYDTKKYSEPFTDKDKDGKLCKHTIWGKERKQKDIVYRVSIFVRDNKIAKVHLTPNVELTVKFYKNATSACHDQKVWRIKDKS